MISMKSLFNFTRLAGRRLQRFLGDPQWMVPVFVVFLYRHRRPLMTVWAAFTLWLGYLTFMYVPVIPFVPQCLSEEGRLEPLGGVLHPAFDVEMKLYFAPFRYESARVARVKRPHQHIFKFYISPWDALDLNRQTSRATLSAAYSIWYGLSDEDRARAPEPGNTDLSECEVVRLYALLNAPRTWDQCVWFSCRK